MNKDRELREILINLVNQTCCHMNEQDKFVDKAISQIKALYKPLGKEELIEIAKKNLVWTKTIIKITKAEKKKSPIKEKFTLKPDFDILAQAIINARGE